MKLKCVLAPLACVVVLLLNGCVGTVDGRHRGGMPFQSDRIEGRYARPTADLWAAARDVLKFHGAINSEDVVRQSLQGNVDERNIWITISAVDANVSQVIVQARTKSGFADYHLAIYLEKEIAVRLASGNSSPVLPPKR